jgi:hypothetical protein
MHLHRLPSRTVLGWLAAALVAAAAVFVPVALVLDDRRLAGAVVAVVAIAFYAVVRPRAVPSLLLGAALNAAALYGAFILLLIGGDCDDDGHIPVAVWVIGALVYGGFALWALQRGRRAWWGLPLATLTAAVVIVGLATVFTGSTGACLS